MHAALLELGVEELARVGGREALDALEVAHRVGDQRRAHLGDRRAPLEVDAHRRLDRPPGDLREVLGRLRELLGAVELDLDAAVRAGLHVGGEALEEPGHVVRGRHLVRDAHDDRLGGRGGCEHERRGGGEQTKRGNHRKLRGGGGVRNRYASGTAAPAAGVSAPRAPGHQPVGLVGQHRLPAALRGEPDQLVERVEGREARLRVRRRAGAADRREQVAERVGDRVGRRDREDDCRVADRLELGGGQDRRAARLDVVREAGTRHLAADPAHLVDVGRRLDEQEVGAGLARDLRALDRLVDAVDGERVGARHHDEVRIGARVERRAELRDPFGGRNHRLARHVAAALREHLVLEEQARDAGALVEAHGARDVGHVAEAGIRVGEDRQRGRLGEAPVHRRHLGERELRGVRRAEQRRRRAVAALRDRIEAGCLGDPRAERVVHARHHQDAGRGDELLQAGRAAQGRAFRRAAVARPALSTRCSHTSRAAWEPRRPGLASAAAPAGAHRVLVPGVLDVELALPGALERPADPLRQVDVGRRHDRALLALVDRHDPVERVLLALVPGLVAHEVQDVVAVRGEERALDRERAGGQLLARAPARRTDDLVRVGWRLAPLPAALVERRAAAFARGGLAILAGGLVGVVPEGVVDARAVPLDAAVRRGGGGGPVFRHERLLARVPARVDADTEPMHRLRRRASGAR